VLVVLLGTLFFGFSLSPRSAGAVATALLREGQVIPGGAPGQIVSSVNNTAVNQVGGYAVQTNTADGLSHVWGHATGGSGTILRTEATIGGLVQTSFESFYGISDAGQVCYSASGTGGPVGAFDSVWLDGTVLAVEGAPIPSMPGQYWRFASRPGVTATGIPYWVGGTTNTPGGSTQRRGLFYSAAATVVLYGGTAVPGLPFILGNTDSPTFDYRYSALGTHFIAPVLMQSGSTLHDGAMVYDGAGLVVAGVLVREQTPVPLAAGGLPGENWDNFDFCGATEAGDWFFTGDTEPATANDEIICKNGVILYREGQTLDGEVLSGAIEGAFMNEDGDIAFIWDVQNDTQEALFVNDQLLLREGDAVDLSGDGAVEPASILVNFTGISALTMGPQDGLGEVQIYFTADVDTAGTSSTLDDVEAFFCIGANVAPPVAATLQSFAAEATEAGVRLAWTTSREIDHAGFHLYRSPGGAAAWERRTDSLVRGTGGRYEFLDTAVEPGTRYRYRLGAVDLHGREELLGHVEVTAAGLVGRTALHGSFPNPFAGATEVRFRLGRGGPARIAVYDASGRVVRRLVEATLPAGEHVLRGDGRDGAGRPVVPGLYFARLATDGRVLARKMLRMQP
jgi:hypothetical protein